MELQAQAITLWQMELEIVHCSQRLQCYPLTPLLPVPGLPAHRMRLCFEEELWQNPQQKKTFKMYLFGELPGVKQTLWFNRCKRAYHSHKDCDHQSHMVSLEMVTSPYYNPRHFPK